MLKSNLKIALRSLLRQKGYAFINVFGLAVGIGCCLLIFLLIFYEYTFDRFHERADRIYRIATTETYEGQVQAEAQAPQRLPALLASNFPEVEHVVRLYPHGSEVVASGGKVFVEEDNVYTAEPALFDVFTFPLRRGDPNVALDAPFSVVISPMAATKYFGQADPLGETLRIDDNAYTVTGVLEPIPAQSHLRFDILISYSTRRALFGDAVDEIARNWRAGVYTYVLLHPAADASGFAERLSEEVNTRVEEPALSFAFDVQPLRRIHLHSNLQYELHPGNPSQLYLLGAIALFILGLACTNFVNMSTARAVGRAREVGVRKVMGARRSQLIRQFIAEALMLSLAALMVAMLIVEALLPLFSELVETPLQTAYLDRPWLLLALLAFALLTAVLAGSYPAFYLSRFRPAIVLKGKSRAGSGARMRRVLVVFQFTVTTVLIVGTLVVHRQMRYIEDRPLGFDEEQVVVLRLRDTGTFSTQYAAFKQALLQRPQVLGVTASTSIGPLGALEPFGTEGDDQLEARWMGVDDDFVETLGIEIVEGRGFSAERPADRRGFILNESAARMLRTDSAIGASLTYNRRQGRVIGVVKDFHEASLHEPIGPVVMYRMSSRATPFVSVRLAPHTTKDALSRIRATWQEFVPGWPFEYRFLDEYVDALYRSERRLQRTFQYASLLALLIACLGLFGLAAFTAEQRTKEVGVRKVLGASVTAIVALLTKDVARLVIAAVALAAPLAWIAMDRWLEAFAYRIEIGGAVFVVAAALALGVALLTVSYQAVRAARLDPVAALRHD